MHGRVVCMVGGMHGRGVGACMAGGHMWWGACMAGVMHGGGVCVWQGGMCGGGARGACMAGGMHDTHAPRPRADTAATAYGQ